MKPNRKPTGSENLDQADHLPISVRAIAVRSADADAGAKSSKPKRAGKATTPSTWTLVFDTETTVDSAQRL
jgi:hypothetical protein